MMRGSTLLPGLLFIINYLLLPFSTLAVGSTVNATPVYALGDIRPIRAAPVGIVSEELHLRVNGAFTDVRVQYKLQNIQVDIPKSVTYGLPLEVAYRNLSDDVNWRDADIPEIRFILDGKELEITREIEQHFDYRPIDGNAEGIKTRKVWYITDFQIPAGKLASLDIYYTVKNGFADWSKPGSSAPTLDRRRLFYEFSPAPNWANGILPKLDVHLNYPENAETSLEGLALDPSGTYQGINLVLDDLPALYLEYQLNTDKVSQHFRAKRIANERIQSIRASSSLAGDYEAAHLLDQNFSTAWVEGEAGNGIGARIEILFKEGVYLSSLGMLNGYTKSERAYQRNNRIKKIRVQLTGENTLQEGIPEMLTFDRELPDRSYRPLDQHNFAAQLDVLYDPGEIMDGFQVKRIELTILEVYPGARFFDTCLSEIYLLSR